MESLGLLGFPGLGRGWDLGFGVSRVFRAGFRVSCALGRRGPIHPQEPELE